MGSDGPLINHFIANWKIEISATPKSEILLELMTTNIAPTWTCTK